MDPVLDLDPYYLSKVKAISDKSSIFYNIQLFPGSGSADLSVKEIFTDPQH
jgi:hypothetical protein